MGIRIYKKNQGLYLLLMTKQNHIERRSHLHRMKIDTRKGTRTNMPEEMRRQRTRLIFIRLIN